MASDVSGRSLVMMADIARSWPFLYVRGFEILEHGETCRGVENPCKSRTLQRQSQPPVLGGCLWIKHIQNQ
jgi:hypothetical protein